MQRHRITHKAICRETKLSSLLMRIVVKGQYGLMGYQVPPEITKAAVLLAVKTYERKKDKDYPRHLVPGLRALMAISGITQSEVARKVGVTQGRINQMLTGYYIQDGIDLTLDRRVGDAIVALAKKRPQ
jgi:hypothetical protein